MSTVIPPDEIFNSLPKPLADTQGAYTMENWTRLEHPKEGGMLSYYTGHPFPFKGQPYAPATEANNIVKKLTLGILMSLVPQRNWLEKILYNYCRLSDYTNRQFYLKREYYKRFGVEMWDFIYFFLRNMGISDDVSYRTGRIVCNFFEWDDAYRYRIQDLMSESSKELLKNPRKESKRLLQIFLERETCIGENIGLDNKAKKIHKLLSILFLIPKVKRSFLKALEEINFQNLQLDKIDKYWCCQFHEYNYMGRTFEDRLNEFIKEQAIYNFNNQLLDIVGRAKNPNAVNNINQVKQYV